MSQTFAQILSSINNTETRIALEAIFQILGLDRDTKVGDFIDIDTSFPGASFTQGLPAPTGVDTIQFNTDFVDGNEIGRLQWNDPDGTLEYGLGRGNVNLQIGQEQVIFCRNNSGEDLVDGQAAYVSGAQGNRPTIALACADSIVTSGAVGVLTENIDNNSDGYITSAGLVRGLDTSDFSDGDLLWLSCTTPGNLSATRPTAPNRSTVIGYVLNAHVTQGILAVRPTIVPGLLSLSDVLAAAPNNGDTIRWSTANSRFELGA